MAGLLGSGSPVVSGATLPARGGARKGVRVSTVRRVGNSGTMAVFEYTTVIPHPRAEVFAWFARPGALVRLSPPFSGSVRQEPTEGIEVGSTAVIGVGAPGVLGIGAGSVAGVAAGLLPLPGWARPEIPWHARHTRLDPGRSFTDVMDSGPLEHWEHTHTFEDDAGDAAGAGAADSLAGPVGADGDAGAGGRPGTVMRDRIEFELPLASTLPVVSELPLLSKLPWGRAARWSEELFARELRRIFAYRERQLLADLRFHSLHSGAPRTVAVTGASGLIGTQLCALLAGGGHRVIRLVRRAPRGPDEVRWDPERGVLDAEALRSCDAVVHLAGQSIGGRFTPEMKQKVMSSRTAGTSLIARTLAELAGDGRRRTLVGASGIGYYGTQPHRTGPHGAGPDGTRPQGAGLDGAGEVAEETAADDAGPSPSWPTPLTEDAAEGDGFLAQVCGAWEKACDPAREAGVRVVNLRTGLVQSPSGGILQRLLPLYVAGVGGPLGGDQWQSWIGIDDIVGLYAFAVLEYGEDAATGPLNAVAPVPVTARDYAKTLARVLRRPAAVPVPAFGPRLLLGEQGARELTGADQRVSAAKSESWGYEFRHRTLEAALRHVLGKA